MSVANGLWHCFCDCERAGCKIVNIECRPDCSMAVGMINDAVWDVYSFVILLVFVL